MLFSVHNDCCNLLVHEDQDRDQKSWKGTCQVDPPGVFSKGEHKPSSIQAGGLEVEFRKSGLPERLGQPRGFMLLIGSLLCACSYPQLAPKLYTAQNIYCIFCHGQKSHFSLSLLFDMRSPKKNVSQGNHRKMDHSKTTHSSEIHIPCCTAKHLPGRSNLGAFFLAKV